MRVRNAPPAPWYSGHLEECVSPALAHGHLEPGGAVYGSVLSLSSVNFLTLTVSGREMSGPRVAGFVRAPPQSSLGSVTTRSRSKDCCHRTQTLYFFRRRTQGNTQTSPKKQTLTSSP